MRNKKKIGIVLEGGGAKGSYEIGVQKALNELEIKYDYVVGTSIGSLNAVSYVLNEYEKYSYMWSKMNFNFKNGSDNEKINKKQLTLNELVQDIDLYENEYLNSKGIDPSGLIEMLKNNIDEDSVRSAKINFGLATYCITDKKPLYLFLNDIPYGQLHEYIFASCNLPVFTPRPINNKYYVDGSYFSRLPIDMLIDKELDVIITVRLRTDKYDFSKYKNVKIIDIAPNEFLSDTLKADQDRIIWMMNKGYEDAIKILNENISLL
jgi:NTE family protein